MIEKIRLILIKTKIVSAPSMKLSCHSSYRLKRESKKGVWVGFQRVHTEMMQPRKPWLFQCSKCLKQGHISTQRQNQQRCSKCSEEGHNYPECSQQLNKSSNCQGNHTAVSKVCPVIQKRLQELSEKDSNRYG